MKKNRIQQLVGTTNRVRLAYKHTILSLIVGEVIGACTVIGKENVLFHFNLKQPGNTEMRVKSSSERLNQCITKAFTTRMSKKTNG